MEKNKKSNNLQLMRFIAAIVVIVSHAHPLSDGSRDLVTVLSGDTLYVGPYGLYPFFVFSGFLIAKSLLRKDNVKAGSFFKARLVRLIPPLAFTVFACAILGVFFTTLTPSEYFTSAQTYKYLLNSIFIIVHNLPGVFTGNRYLCTVNGSLWSMCIEFLCYVACFVLYKLRWMEKKKLIILSPFVFAVCAVLIYILPHDIKTGVRAGMVFYIAILYYVFWDNLKFKPLYTVISGILVVITMLLRISYVGIYVFFPYFLLSIAFSRHQCGDHVARLGDYAYGIYLWGFPVQQAIIQINGGSMNAYLNYALSIPVSIILAVITYHLVEKPSAKLLNSKKAG